MIDDISVRLRETGVNNNINKDNLIIRVNDSCYRNILRIKCLVNMI